MHNQQVELCIITVIKYEAKTQYLTNKDPSTVSALCCKAHRKRHYNLQSDFFFSMLSGKHQRSKQTFQDFCWKVHYTMHNLLFCAHTLPEIRNQHVSISEFLDTE